MRESTSRARRRIALLLLACAPLLSQPAGRQPEAVIRTNVHLVEVSIVATDIKGAPAGGLGAADFRVWDNGKEQTIARLERIGSQAAAGPQELPPNTYSNRIGKMGRPQVLSMVLLDAVNTQFRDQTVARRAVENILEQIQPEDRVAIYAFGSRFRTIHDFSSDKESLLARLRAYHGELPGQGDALEELDLDMGGSSPPPPQLKAMIDANRILDTLSALEAIANHVKGVPGRKSLLWVSAAFPLTVGEAQRTTPGAPPADWRTFPREMQRAMAALSDANVSVYPIDGISRTPPAGRRTTTGTICSAACAWRWRTPARPTC